MLGDARLALEREPAQGFDVLAVDAFSGDSVPVHLITAEAMDVYLRNTDWVLVARNPTVLAQPAIKARSSAIRGIPGLGVWTDDFNNLFDVLK